MKARGELSSKPKPSFGALRMKVVISDEAFGSKTISAAEKASYANTIHGISACAIQCMDGATRS